MSLDREHEESALPSGLSADIAARAYTETNRSLLATNLVGRALCTLLLVPGIPVLLFVGEPYPQRLLIMLHALAYLSLAVSWWSARYMLVRRRGHLFNSLLSLSDPKRDSAARALIRWSSETHVSAHAASWVFRFEPLLWLASECLAIVLVVE